MQACRNDAQSGCWHCDRYSLQLPCPRSPSWSFISQAFRSSRHDCALARSGKSAGPMTVLIYVDTSKRSAIPITSRSSRMPTAETGFGENDPEGVAFEHEVLE